MMLLRIGLIFGLLCVISRADDETSDEKKSLNYQTPVFNNLDTYFIETFDDTSEFSHTWVKSRAKKDNTDEALAKYDGVWDLEQPARDALHGDFGLVLKSKAKHAAIAAKLKRPFVFMNKPFIVQYEVLLQEGQECGGAYLKLLSVDKASSDLTKFHDRTPYTIMFGPDKCGNDHKLHFIFRHKNPKTGNFEEKHCKKPTERIEDYFIDKKPHLYTLILNPDNSFKIYIDHNLVNSGSLLEDFTPEVNPPAEIDDPNDKKPADWDDREKVPDTTATKPENWDDDAPKTIEDPSAKKPEGWLDNEPLNIRDPFAAKPDDWDDDMDGEWEAPLVPNPACEDAPGCGKWSPPTIINPAYKGKWLPPMIDNPNYQGKWAPKRIPNPDYFEDKFPFRMSSIDAVGFELWSMSPNILFDNIVITDKLEIAEELAMKTFDLKKKIMELDAETMWVKMMKAMNYKPGWWSLYFFYCSLPIAAYVWYIYRRVREDTFIGRFINYTNKHPWLWAVYVVVLLIPITLIVIFCFGTSAKERDTLDTDAARKKDDQVSPDDPVSEEQDNQSNVESMVSYFNSEEKGEEDDSEDSSNENKGDTSKDQDIDQQDYQVLEDSDIEEHDNAEDASEDDVIDGPHDPSPRKRCQRID